MAPESLQIAGLFDSPWVVAAILIGSALANWLAQRRAQKAEQEQNESAPPPPPEAGLAGWEEKLRRMLEAQSEPPSATPPPLIPGNRPSVHPGLPPALPPVVRQPPPVQIVTLGDYETFQSQPEPKAPLGGPERTPAPTLPPVVARPPRRRGSNFRHPATARQAFVASLVFGPPKGMES